jgi:hypothetical protein
MEATILMQGPTESTIDDIKVAAADAKPNRDRVFYRVVSQRCEDLRA